jgi:hypothetical protein
MKETSHAKVLATVSLPTGNNEARIERLEIKESGKVEIRFSWWKNGKFILRPLKLSEEDLITLIHQGTVNQVFSPSFIGNLTSAITHV